MQSIGEIPSHPKDKFEAKVFVGSVAGLGTINEAIIMRNEKNIFWTATIIYDELKDDFIVKYHSNDGDFKSKLPFTIEEWRSRFEEFKVVL